MEKMRIERFEVATKNCREGIAAGVVLILARIGVDFRSVKEAPTLRRPY